VTQQSFFSEIVQEVAKLQPYWVADPDDPNDPNEPMHGRGLYVRNDGPAIIRNWLTAIEPFTQTQLGPDGVRGSDGITRKSRVPCIRAYYSQHSPRTTLGWYIVYLFESSGQRLYLSINQGTLDLVNGSLLKKNPVELNNRVLWARAVLKDSGLNLDGFDVEIDLNVHSGELGRSYEQGQVFGKRYDIDDLPGDDVLIGHFKQAWDALQHIHSRELEYQDSSVPTDTSVAEAEEAIRFAAGKGGSGQGFGLTKPEKDAVEKQAMDRVKKHYSDAGWIVKDTSANQPYDLQCSKGGESVFVEVKRTTSKGTSVVLTYNEVAHMQAAFPQTVLAIVSTIKLKKGDNPVATGGELRVINPWKIEDSNLRPIGYKYSVPTGSTKDAEESL